MISYKVVAVYCALVVAARTVSGQQCKGGATCDLLEDCTGLYNQLLGGITPELTSVLRRLHCGFQSADKPMVCCPPEFKGQKQDSRIGGATSTNDILPTTEECGIQNNDRIVGGVSTDLDEHPWMTLLHYDKPNGFGYYCGGVLISKKYVMTAAHCIKGDDLPSTWKLSQVRLGEWNTSSARDCLKNDCSGPTVDVPIEEAIVHEGYEPTSENQENDIALLRLSRNVEVTDFIKPICLPLSDDVRQSSFDGYVMEVAGWGKTESRSESDVKLKVRVPVVKNRDCARVFSRVQRKISTMQLCAGGTAGRDSCRGDSGGPLMARVENANNWYAVGVVSYGPTPCGTPGWPGVYTRVGAYIPWIRSKIRP